MDNNGCLQFVIMGIIWLGSPFLFSIIMPLISGCEKGLCEFLNFIVAPISIIISTIVISGLALIRALAFLILSLFRKEQETSEYSQKKERPLSFGLSAIPTCTITFALAGVFAPLYTNPTSSSIIISYAITGFVWGFVPYLLFQKEILDFDDF